jgi:hypothetical protein
MKPFRAFLASFAIGLVGLSTGHGLLSSFAEAPAPQLGPIGNVTA